ncbi:MAG: MraY family glycosyltransferase [Ignavibacteriaceae bacterium]
MQYLTISFLSFIFTVFLTQYIIRFLTNRNVVDHPNGESRKMHDVAVPRLGGVVIFFVVVISTFIFYQDFWSKKYFLIGAMIIFGIGVWDDLSPKKWYIKIVFQITAALFLILSITAHNYSVITFGGYVLPAGLNYIIMLLLITGIINSFNLLDGLDGLVTGLTLIVAAMCFLLSFGNRYDLLPAFSSALVGSTLGFLKFNANPAKIFLGDSGSLTLGYFVTGLLLIVSGDDYSVRTAANKEAFSVDLLFLIIVLAVPITDTLRVMFLRIRKQTNPFLADSIHIHHILYSKKIRHKTVVLMINTLTAGFALLGVYYLSYSKLTAVIVFIILLILLLFTEKILDVVISKNNLLAFGRGFRLIPSFMPVMYKNFFVPALGICSSVLIAVLLISEIEKYQTYNVYFLFFLVPSLIYSALNLMKRKYYVDILIFLNLIIFFVITGLSGIFYTMYSVPVITQINLNQIYIFIFTVMIIQFILFKERIINYNIQFLNGVDLSIALSITFVFIMSHFLDISPVYKISDTLLRSFHLFLFFKIVIILYPKFHFTLHFASFAIAILAVIITIF